MSKVTTIGIDVDGVLAVSTPLNWGLVVFKDFEYELDKYKRYEDFSNTIKTNKDKLLLKDPFDWWKNPFLYDDLTLEYSIELLLQSLESKYSNIEYYVLSDCFEQHQNSKEQFCKRVLGNKMKGFHNLKEKYKVKCDLYIDDKPSNLVACKKQHPASETILVKHFYNNINDIENEYIDREFKVLENFFKFKFLLS